MDETGKTSASFHEQENEMRDIDDTPLANPWKRHLPQPWTEVIKKAIERHGLIRGELWIDPLVVIRNGMPAAVPYEDPVLDGIARKTAQRLRHICSCCGKPAKPRALPAGWAIKCSACWGRSQLSEQIDTLLDEAHGANLTPYDGKPALWHEHEMPVLLRCAIPSFCWRKLSLPEGGTLRYLAREDVRELMPWLKEVQWAMGSGEPSEGSTSHA